MSVIFTILDVPVQLKQFKQKKKRPSINIVLAQKYFNKEHWFSFHFNKIYNTWITILYFDKQIWLCLQVVVSVLGRDVIANYFLFSTVVITDLILSNHSFPFININKSDYLFQLIKLIFFADINARLNKNYVWDKAYHCLINRIGRGGTLFVLFGCFRFVVTLLKSRNLLAYCFCRRVMDWEAWMGGT